MLQAIVLGVITNFIYQHTLAPDAENILVNITSNEVVIEQGETRIVVPRNVYDATRQAESNPEFSNNISEAARAIEADDSIISIGFSSDMNKAPEVVISRPQLRLLVRPTPTDDTERDLTEVAELEILRAILEKSRRRWEFVRNGMRISAPVLDAAFYDDFSAHRITIAPGDRLRVKLRIRQKRLPGIGIFINESYEVIEVLEHIPQDKQTNLPHQ